MLFNNSELLDFIRVRYNKTELKILCFRLEIQDEEVEKPTLNETIIEIIKYCQRRSRLYELVNVIEKERGSFGSIVPPSPPPISPIDESDADDNAKFDVFLCHNNIDKPEVRQIGERLEALGIRAWLDEEALLPGSPWLPILDEQIKNAKSVAVFFGKNGLGPWQNVELQAFLQEYVKRQCKIIPVILSDSPENLEIPSVIKTLQWVDFRKLQPNPIEKLVLGIRRNNTK